MKKEMTAARKNHVIMVAAIVLLVLMAFGMTSGSYAKTSKTSVSGSQLQAGKQFTLSEMPYSGQHSIIKTYNGQTVTPSGVQNFAFTPDGKYIFNLGIARISGKEHPLLTRCVLPAARNAAQKAECKEAIVLCGYAHPEVLEITQPNLSQEVYHIWVASAPASNYMGREITRLTLEVRSTGSVITKRVSINGFKNANTVDGKSTTFKGGKAPVAVCAALDTASNQIVFRLRMPSGLGVVYVSYNFAKINAVLDNLPDNGKYNIANAKDWQRAILRCGVRPCDSLQSFDVSGNKLYLCGGHFNKGAQIYVVNYKLSAEGKAKEQVTVSFLDLGPEG